MVTWHIMLCQPRRRSWEILQPLTADQGRSTRRLPVGVTEGRSPAPCWWGYGGSGTRIIKTIWVYFCQLFCTEKLFLRLLIHLNVPAADWLPLCLIDMFWSVCCISVLSSLYLTVWLNQQKLRPPPLSPSSQLSAHQRVMMISSHLLY